MKKIIIIGAGGFGREVKMLIDHINKSKPQYEFVGYYDDGIQKGTFINGFPVLGSVLDVNLINEKTYVALGLGSPIYKKNVTQELNNSNLIFETLIHPSVLIGSDEIKFGRGIVICAGSIITCNIAIHDFVTVNLACTIGHDSVLKDFVSIMPGCNISGEVIIENGVYIGTGAKVINQVTIGENSIIGAGAVVSKPIPENCTAVGIPAKPLKYHK
jgi:sugar O-acyltransferase (sialic acid O-acetyltransferase NeuD family)